MNVSMLTLEMNSLSVHAFSNFPNKKKRFQQGTIGNEKNGGVSGWRDGRPAASGFWDEDSAYWIDGMVRLGLVLNDTTLVARASQDYAATLANPISFHNTWKSAHDLSSGSAEGWVRSVYSRGMLAYYDATGNKDILNFIVNAFSNYTAASSTSDRSLTQIEALFEGHAYGGPVQTNTTPPAFL